MIRRARILVADEPARSSDDDLGLEGRYAVRWCDPEALPRHIDAFRPDLVVIHLADGREPTVATLARRIHASYRPLVLCAVADHALTAAALEAGADGCLAAPYTADELGAHVRALLRRVPWLAHALVQVGSLIIDESSHTTVFGDDPVTLPAKEFGLLAALARDAGIVLSKRTLLERLWGFDRYDENLVEVHISSLRRHLPPDAARMVHTVRGLGYVLRDEPSQGRPDACR